jgi:hypothetical protein
VFRRVRFFARFAHDVWPKGVVNFPVSSARNESGRIFDFFVVKTFRPSTWVSSNAVLKGTL